MSEDNKVRLCDKELVGIAHVNLVHGLEAVFCLTLAQPVERAQVLLQDLQDDPIGCYEALGHAHNILIADRGRHAIGCKVVVGVGLVLIDIEVIAFRSAVNI